MTTDPRLDTTRRWTNTRLTAVIIGIIFVFAVAGSVFFLMAGGVGDENTVLEDPPAADASAAP